MTPEGAKGVGISIGIGHRIYNNNGINIITVFIEYLLCLDTILDAAMCLHRNLSH